MEKMPTKACAIGASGSRASSDLRRAPVSNRYFRKPSITWSWARAASSEAMVSAWPCASCILASSSEGLDPGTEFDLVRPGVTRLADGGEGGLRDGVGIEQGVVAGIGTPRR